MINLQTLRGIQSRVQSLDDDFEAKHDRDEHGKFAAGDGAEKGGRKDPRAVRDAKGKLLGTIMFRSRAEGERNRIGRGPSLFHVKHLLTSDEQRKVAHAAVVFQPDFSQTAHIGAPVKWTAPNGVLVVYARGQRRNERDEKTGEGSWGTYHDFNPDDEWVVPATLNVGSGRRALRAWAQEFLTDKVSARAEARRMVRPGD